MTRKSVERKKKTKVIGVPLYIAVLLFSVILFGCTVLWVKDSEKASEQMINLLGEFYLEEITESNANTIVSKIESKTSKIIRAVDELDTKYLENEEAIRGYIALVASRPLSIASGIVSPKVLLSKSGMVTR